MVHPQAQPAGCSPSSRDAISVLSHSVRQSLEYWEWYRKDGTRMRSGHFESDQQCGGWITHDQQGKVSKVTVFKPKKKRSARALFRQGDCSLGL